MPLQVDTRGMVLYDNAARQVADVRFLQGAPARRRPHHTHTLIANVASFPLHAAMNMAAPIAGPLLACMLANKRRLCRPQ